MDRDHKLRILLGGIHGKKREELKLRLLSSPSAIDYVLRKRMDSRVRPIRWRGASNRARLNPEHDYPCSGAKGLDQSQPDPVKGLTSQGPLNSWSKPRC